jgi:hypothetical protein
MRSINRGAVVLFNGVMILLAMPVCAQVVYQTGFEPPAFTAGSSVDGQGGFAVTTGDPNAITVSTNQPHSGAQDLLFTGRALTDSGGGFYIGTAGVTPNFNAANDRVTLDAEVLLSGPSTATGVGHTGDLVSLNMEALLDDGSYFSTYLSSDGNAYGFSTNYDAMTPVTLGVYHDLQLVLDFGSHTANYIVDGTTFGTKPFDASVTSSVISSLQFSMYAIDPPADRTQYFGRVDDFAVTAVPETSPLIACLIGVCMVAGFTLRQRLLSHHNTASRN